MTEPNATKTPGQVAYEAEAAFWAGGFLGEIRVYLPWGKLPPGDRHAYEAAAKAAQVPVTAATPIVAGDITCACEGNDWVRRHGTDGHLVVCRSCGYIGLIVEQPGTISVHRVTLSLCSRCLSGAGGECHTPDCSLWMQRAPGTRVYLAAGAAPKED